uniref:Uncharacterized protein n=1 Tax=Rhizophora mucronata TaxID=61149 RepID=A0A2P2KWB7_RHIMU
MRGSGGCLALQSQFYSSSSYLYCKAPLAKGFSLHHHQHISAASSSSSWSCNCCRRRKCHLLSLSLSLTPFSTYRSFTLKNKRNTHIPKFVPSTFAFMLDNSNSTQQPTPPIDTEKGKDKDTDKVLVSGIMPKIDKSGRFCSPRAARELSLLIVYAACLEGSDPVRLFEKRMNVRRDPSYRFDKESLLEYNHMSFGGPPVVTETAEEADELLHSDEMESAVEAEVLSAPPKLVYSKLILRFTRKLLVAVVDNWDSHVLILDKVVPSDWKV